MKSNSLTVLVIIAIALVVLFIVWGITNTEEHLAPDNNDYDESRNVSNIDIAGNEESISSEGSFQETSGNEEDVDTKDEPSIEESVTESSSSSNNSEDLENEQSDTSFEEQKYDGLSDKKIYKYINIVNGGVYKYKTTEQRQIGGLSVPVVTTTWFGDGHISIIEKEMHNISTEIYIDADGAYMINAEENTADLISKHVIDIPTPNFESLSFITDGYTSISSVLYEYERYKNADQTIIDYLFLDCELKKAKIYSNDYDYEIISIEITDDISDGRCELPSDLKVTDRR